MTKKLICAFALIAFACTTSNAQTLTLTPSNFNFFNISCFGRQDGSINLTITGGTPPYTIVWSNEAITEDISNLAAGFYQVEVDDANNLTEPVTAEITLREPEPLSVRLTPSDYIINGRHYNECGKCI